ncbi:hypothetical protein GPECTOR_10g911 [Gonium pectorale]|uniref:Uncharacterized protein n=1 Tax=Gonium pectorale TaxID=33097 RepID=A0A150GR15_GONPE|nr:hypothetical protein GPECTOR_10g911 [Gonium pectorale]|eukprot:KXZ52279.1 hypothetical protein GPECTOR_10g911 [Gonium pectorale]
MACVVCAAKATVYCDNDKALLCKDCDTRIHMSNAVAARHVRRVPCEGGCRGGASLFCRCDNAYMCDGCHSSNPLASSHKVEPVAPLPALEEEFALLEHGAFAADPCESVAQSAASPGLAWFVDDEKATFPEPAVLSPTGSEAAVVPVVSPPLDDLAFSAPATFKDIKDKLEFEPFELDNGWLEMGFDFTDILSDTPSDVGLVPTFDGEAAEAIADAMVPTFPEELPIAEVPSQVEVGRKRLAEANDDELPAKVPSLAPELSQPSQALFSMVPPAHMLFPMIPPAPVQPPAPAPAPKSNAASYQAALAAGANLTREQRVARYREKRKNRKFEKTIRYASRKAYAEIRPRIKGRFAKKEEIEAWKAAHGGEDAVVPEVLDGDF